MPMIIYKYEIPVRPKFTLDLPIGLEILSVQVQHGIPVFWAMVDSEADKQVVQFMLIPTGALIDGEIDNDLTYIDTVQLQGGDLVMHLFEVLED